MIQTEEKQIYVEVDFEAMLWHYNGMGWLAHQYHIAKTPMLELILLEHWFKCDIVVHAVLCELEAAKQGRW